MPQAQKDDAQKNDPLLPMVTEIVVAYLSHNTVPMADIPRLIAETRQGPGAERPGRPCRPNRRAAGG